MNQENVSRALSEKRQEYLPPAIEIFDVENEGVMATSMQDMIDGGKIGGEPMRTNYGTSHELEDLINDILTFEE